MSAVLILSPDMFSSSVKRDVIDGEIWALASWLETNGFDTVTHDGYWTKRLDLSKLLREVKDVDCIVLHLWKVDALDIEVDRFIEDFRLQISKTSASDIPVVVFGHTVDAIVHSLKKPSEFINACVTADHSKFLRRVTGNSEIDNITKLIQSYLGANTGATNLTSSLTHNSAAIERISQETIVSLHASRGCRSRCTFCCYNSDLAGGWRPRSAETIVDEIQSVLGNTKSRRISFFDNDFGGSESDLTSRSKEMYDLMKERKILGLAELSINVRSECLNEENIDTLKRIGVKNMLIGVESFNEITLRRVFGKKMSIPHLKKVVSVADEYELNVVLSYILWHPWQTFSSLVSEIEKIDEIGRHRVPQFLTRSYLQVVAGTPVQKMISKDDLLPIDKKEHFRFQNNDVAHAYRMCSEKFSKIMSTLRKNTHGLSKESSIKAISNAKIVEWNFYKDFFRTNT